MILTNIPVDPDPDIACLNKKFPFRDCFASVVIGGNF